ncbi:MAG: hypothetical protein U0R64_01465 [Candidatus Nanopelagicales bacterium]
MPDWDPTGDVLVVAHDLAPEVRADIEQRLAGTTVTLLDLGPRDRVVVEEDGADEGFPADSDAAVAAITDHLAAHPATTSLLAQSRWAARDVWRVVRPRPELRGFTHLDNLDRARSGRLVIDVSPWGRRRASHRFALEFAGTPVPTWPQGARNRVLIGPGNDFAQASGWAAATRTWRRTAALSLTVGDDGFPADLIATEADWSALSVRNQVLRLAQSATHLVLDEDSEVAGQLAAAGDATVVRAHDLPPCVSPRPPRAPVSDHLVVIGDGPVPDTEWRVTRLADLPRGVWAGAVLTASVIIDHRGRFDTLVARAMAEGVALVSDAELGVPCAPVAADVIGDSSLRRALAEAGRAYVSEHCSPETVSAALRKTLGIRWWR